VAENDTPLLVAFAAAQPAAGDALLRAYVSIHVSNPYADYRNRSLWGILGAILLHPVDEEARELVRLVAAGALAPTPVRFGEGLMLAVQAERARLGDTAARDGLARQTAEALAAANALTGKRWQSDSWGHHRRRLAALAESEAVSLGGADAAAHLLDRAASLPFGFAGYQAPASLSLAEANRVCRPGETAAARSALAAAREAAHNIQEPSLCVRTTARVNAMLEQWWPAPDDLAAVVERFAADPHAAEFAPIHHIGEQYERRVGDERLSIPDTIRRAATLAQLARDGFQLPLAALETLNPGVDANAPLQEGTAVRVPDVRFAPLLAARLAAEVLVSPSVDGTRTALLRRLVPSAVDNASALDAVLSRLLLSARATEPGVLDAVAVVAPWAWMEEPTARAAVEFGPA
jgi:hypothetical protein